MLAEPFNAILWHSAVVAKACSAEIAERGSAGLSNELFKASSNYLYLTNVINDQFVASTRDGTQQFIFDITKNAYEKLATNLPPPELNSITIVLRNYDELLKGLTQDVGKNQIDFVEFDSTIDLGDTSLFQLNIFDEIGLRKLFDMNKLIFLLDIVLNPNSSLSLGSRRNTVKLSQAAKNHLLSSQRDLTNALVFDLASRKAKLLP
ncbi:MAG: hypothetical protein F2563_05225 [Actinobacteria bacterium]|uniref:Unannotated protein n=1 Tax=freshwater metagenome TaxID=449393 RepID=A0A6J6F3I3_9ZZZZ|nr:hypothetical protein [Actinomycetota bacterium]